MQKRGADTRPPVLHGRVGAKLTDYGFIWTEPDGDTPGLKQEEWFFHHSAAKEWDELEPGDMVTFQVMQSGKKRRAVKVRRLGDEDHSDTGGEE